MVVLIIDEDGVFAFKLERQPPVSADADCPVIFEFRSQPVKVPARSTHVDRLPGVIEGKQLQPQLAGVFGLNSSFRSRAEEFLHTAVPKALDHPV